MTHMMISTSIPTPMFSPGTRAIATKIAVLASNLELEGNYFIVGNGRNLPYCNLATTVSHSNTGKVLQHIQSRRWRTAEVYTKDLQVG